MASRGEIIALLRNDFHSFVQRCFAEINPQGSFLDNWHLEILCAKLDAVRRGDTTRLIVNIPPRHLKSICASVALPAWVLGHDPGTQIICASYAQDLSEKLARDCRQIMKAGWYGELFGPILADRRPAAGELVTIKGGFRLATSVGGVLTGRGADLIIIDDPLKPAEASSEAQRRAANEWFDGTLFSRQNDKRRGAIVIIMQRLHEDDLVGHVLEREGWDLVRFPAIAEQNEVHEVDTVFGRRRFARKAGDLLHPDREPMSALEDIRRSLGPYNFAGQYQQSPAPLGGGLVKREWFRFYDPDHRPLPSFSRVVQSWDTANTVGELSDFSVCTTWGVEDREAFLIDVFRGRLEYPALKRAVHMQAERFSPSAILIEDRASGTQLIQELRYERLPARPIRPEGDKVMRMHAQTAAIENGLVHLPKTAPWLDEYLLEMTAFPRGKHDDQADSTSQFLEWLTMAPRRPVAFSMPMRSKW